MLTNGQYTSIWGFFTRIWASIVEWFTTLFTATGMLPVVLGVIIAMLAIRFILYPALKPDVGSSDTVKNRKVKK